MRFLKISDSGVKNSIVIIAGRDSVVNVGSVKDSGLITGGCS